MDQDRRSNKSRTAPWARIFKVGAALMTVWALAVATTTLLRVGPASLATASAPAAAHHAPGAWGSEVLAVAREQALELSPFAVANACGIGASSCFKCHNGTRAPAPKADKTANPWHTDHRTVNDSCVGCHAGQARLIKKELAHANLVNDPRGKAEQCASCHKGGDAAMLAKNYQAVAKTGK